MKIETQFLIMCDYTYCDGLRSSLMSVPVLVVPELSRAEEIIRDIKESPQGDYGRIVLDALENDRLPADARFSVCGISVAAEENPFSAKEEISQP